MRTLKTGHRIGIFVFTVVAGIGLYCFFEHPGSWTQLGLIGGAILSGGLPTFVSRNQS